MATKIKAHEVEKLTPTNIEYVMALLNPKEEGVKPITKKLACEILGIAYNTTRLDRIINEYLEKKALSKKRRAEKRGKPISIDEASYIVSSYLEDEPLSKISESIYRPVNLIKDTLEKYGVPLRAQQYNYFTPELIPDISSRTRFKLKEKVYSARYESLATVLGEQPHPVHGYVYRIWLIAEKWQRFAYQPADELASLDSLREAGITV